MKSNIKIPKTGKIGNLTHNIEIEAERDILLKVMCNVEKFTSTKDRVVQAEWIKGAIERLEQEVGREKSIIIMESCGRDCVKKHLRNERVMNDSKSIEKFLEKLNRGNIHFELKDKNTILGKYKKCFCYMVQHTSKSFPTKTYCYCGVGHIKGLFESFFKKPVEVELVQSVITGAKSCEFLIHL